MIGTIHKYPRTPHLAGSRLQPGDDDLVKRGFAEWVGDPGQMLRFTQQGLDVLAAKGRAAT
jgi:hypothetical protein